MTTCTNTTAAEAPSRAFTSPWLIDGLIARRGVTMLTGDWVFGRHRLMGHILAHMMNAPDGGPVLHSDNDGSALCHQGFRRMLYFCGDESSNAVQGRLNDCARAAGFDPQDGWPINYMDVPGPEIHAKDFRRTFARAVLASRQYDVLVINPARVFPASQNFILLRHLRRWSTRYGVAIVFMTPSLHDGNLPPTVTARLTLERLRDPSNGRRECVLRREPSLPALADLRLLDLGDPLGFRLAA